MRATVVTVVVAYDCACCSGPVSATLRCEGDLGSLDAPPRVPLGCPHCGRTNYVTFAPDGEVLGVEARRRGEPIWN